MQGFPNVRTALRVRGDIFHLPRNDRKPVRNNLDIFQGTAHIGAHLSVAVHALYRFIQLSRNSRHIGRHLLYITGIGRQHIVYIARNSGNILNGAAHSPLCLFVADNGIDVFHHVVYVVQQLIGIIHNIVNRLDLITL